VRARRLILEGFDWHAPDLTAGIEADHHKEARFEESHTAIVDKAPFGIGGFIAIDPRLTTSFDIIGFKEGFIGDPFGFEDD